MSTIPVIASAEDVAQAVIYAHRRPEARWYVAKRAESLGVADRVPRSWGIAAAGPPQAIRDKMADKGTALPDGSFPISDREGLQKAIKAFGRAKDKAKAKRHIIKRARALKATNELPESWGVTAAGLVAASIRGIASKIRWDPSLHPRGRDGRFIEKGGSVDIFGGVGFSKPEARGRAVGVRREGDNELVQVEITDAPGGGEYSVGDTVEVDVDNVEAGPAEKARLDWPNEGPAIYRAPAVPDAPVTEPTPQAPDDEDPHQALLDEAEAVRDQDPLIDTDLKLIENSATMPIRQRRIEMLRDHMARRADEESALIEGDALDQRADAVMNELDERGAEYDEDTIDDTVYTVLQENPDMGPGAAAMEVAERLDLDAPDLEDEVVEEDEDELVLLDDSDAPPPVSEAPAPPTSTEEEIVEGPPPLPATPDTGVEQVDTGPEVPWPGEVTPQAETSMRSVQNATRDETTAALRKRLKQHRLDMQVEKPEPGSFEHESAQWYEQYLQALIKSRRSASSGDSIATPKPANVRNVKAELKKIDARIAEKSRGVRTHNGKVVQSASRPHGWTVEEWSPGQVRTSFIGSETQQRREEQRIRDHFESLGYMVTDTPTGFQISMPVTTASGADDDPREALRHRVHGE